MKIFFVSLGCDKNRVDSEHMLAVLSKCGAVITDDKSEADVAIINTCSFIEDAKQESIDTIVEMGELKKTGRLKAIIVTGCLAQRYANEIRQTLPEVDVLVGIDSIDKISYALDKALLGERGELITEPKGLPDISTGRMVTTGGHYAHLKISEGCSKHCTYCAIPSFRGGYRSYPVETLVNEAKKLAEGGVKELILVAQETTVYGIDIYGKKSLPQLVRELSDIDGIEWIRLLYCYPEEIDDAFIDMMAYNPKICHYIDMPIQHCADDILKRMGRRTTKAELLEKIDLLRKRIPDICIRTTLIAGFPGESKEQHREVLDFIEKVRFDRLGVFPYSREEGTPAAGFSHQILGFIKKRRADAIMSLQEKIAIDDSAKRHGETVSVFVEGYLPEDDVYTGRTYRDAPDVDGLIFFKSERQLMSGDFADVKITGGEGYDLYGELAGQ